ncbi:hypothetical protein cypCar_00034939 [Cyprinus carpio]|nr:hypothetical protein cypCar_00034939 [Cyprinus carpio]
MTLTGLLLFVLGLTTGENYRIHIYVSTPMTGNRAFTYCKQYYTDLSTITSQEEHQLLVATAGGTFSEAWIGLYRAVKKTDTWIWSDGQSYNFTKLNVNNSEDLDCVYATELEWYNGFCPDKRPFFCYFNYTLNLVTVKMTWEDALIYCRDTFYDLASATEQYQLETLQDTSNASTTEAMWTGLRFLAGEWHWVSESFSHIPYQGSLPSCPEEPYHCGAHNKRTAQWEMRDCQEMLNFICY